MAPHLGGVRTRYKSAAMDASSGFAGFPDFLQAVAKASSQRVFSDQVRLAIQPCAILYKLLEPHAVKAARKVLKTLPMTVLRCFLNTGQPVVHTVSTGSILMTLPTPATCSCIGLSGTRHAANFAATLSAAAAVSRATWRTDAHNAHKIPPGRG